MMGLACVVVIDEIPPQPVSAPSRKDKRVSLSRHVQLYPIRVGVVAIWSLARAESPWALSEHLMRDSFGLSHPFRRGAEASGSEAKAH